MRVRTEDSRSTAFVRFPVKGMSPVLQSAAKARLVLVLSGPYRG